MYVAEDILAFFPLILCVALNKANTSRTGQLQHAQLNGFHTDLSPCSQLTKLCVARVTSYLSSSL